MQIKWLEKALQNLDEEASYIAQNNPQAAAQVMQRIYEAVSALRENPALGHPGRIHGTRELVVPDTRYLIPYRVKIELQQIQILRIFHTSRKPPRRW
ncbi:type II toxin-antitoxin system RelE/ParE family toxin [Cellvibrio sp. NN19]|uniref:type II toxin-antitoxin system RelE/ParE family toxin n=1 Tax=Cellvibrio chitinivorans TaxID=3102792 RepID=UPI002B405213|nr:type II toxin-antitoxin system RelE/ParE family toxin [Cellvibrio sp. NN19]